MRRHDRDSSRRYVTVHLLVRASERASPSGGRARDQIFIAVAVSDDCAAVSTICSANLRCQQHDAGASVYTDNTRRQLERLASLRPRTLAAMHGSTFVGDGAALLTASIDVIREVSAAR